MPSKTSFLRARLRPLVLACVVLAVLAPAARAQGSVVNGYTEKGPSVQQRVGGDQEQAGGATDQAGGAADQANGAAANAGTRRADGGQGGALPFTGLDLALIGGVGVALLGLGVGMQVLVQHTRRAG